MSAKKSSERFHRLAFWVWVFCMFFFVYQSQRFVEGAFSRDSPGKAFDNWFDLKKVYGVPAKVENSNSFPSGHASAYYLFAFLALRRYRRFGYFLLALALAVPSTRLITGAHWVSDIALGSIPLSALCAAIATETRVRKLQRVFETALRDAWYLTRSRHERSIAQRSRTAWREFLAPHSLIPPGAGMQRPWRDDAPQPSQAPQEPSQPSARVVNYHE